MTLPADPDRAAARTLAAVTAPGGEYPPDSVHPDYEFKMSNAGIAPGDTGYILRSMTRRALIIEAAWLQLMYQVSQTTHPRHIATLTRAASNMHKDLMATQSAIYKIRLDQQAGFEPMILSEDLALADDPRAVGHSKGRHGLTTKQVVLAEMEADDIVDAQFRTLPSSSHLADKSYA